MVDWSKQFEALLSSPLGKELIAQLELRKQQLQDEAAQAKSSEEAFGLLKEAGGVITAIAHLRFLAVVPRDEGSQVAKPKKP
jgi:hypothetical protein